MIYKIPFSIFIIILSFISCSKKVPEMKPTFGTITESVYASGVIKAENQYTVFSTVNGVLKKINVIVGQTITKNQPLFDIENENAELNTQNALLTYQLSQEGNRYIQDKISEMQTKVQIANDKLALDESIYLRNKRIKQYNIISEVDYEKVELAYKNSKSGFEAAKMQLSQLKSQLKNEQNKNKNTLKINQKTENDFTVKSAFSGELFDIFVKEGTLITTQMPLAIIGKKNQYLLALDVDENDMVRVKMNQNLLVILDSYKGIVFEAKVDKIYPIMDERSRTFKIEAHFDNVPKKLYPYLTAEANIIIKTKKNVLTVPKSYLINGNYVLVNKDEKRKVKIGLNDYQNAEILSGLKADETIYKPK